MDQSDYRKGDEDNPRSPYYEPGFIRCDMCDEGISEEDAIIYGAYQFEKHVCEDCSNEHDDILDDLDTLSTRLEEAKRIIRIALCENCECNRPSCFTCSADKLFKLR